MLLAQSHARSHQDRPRRIDRRDACRTCSYGAGCTVLPSSNWLCSPTVWARPRRSRLAVGPSRVARSRRSASTRRIGSSTLRARDYGWQKSRATRGCLVMHAPSSSASTPPGTYDARNESLRGSTIRPEGAPFATEPRGMKAGSPGKERPCEPRRPRGRVHPHHGPVSRFGLIVDRGLTTGSLGGPGRTYRLRPPPARGRGRRARR